MRFTGCRGDLPHVWCRAGKIPGPNYKNPRLPGRFSAHGDPPKVPRLGNLEYANAKSNLVAN